MNINYDGKSTHENEISFRGSVIIRTGKEVVCTNNKDTVIVSMLKNVINLDSIAWLIV